MLSYFSKLKSLKHIKIRKWDEVVDFDEIFDPSLILDLEISEFSNTQFLNFFRNLR
jgi:hypothetical protein